MLCIKHNEIPQPPNFLYLIFGIGKDGIFILCSEKHTHTKCDSYVLFNEKIKIAHRGTALLAQHRQSC